MQSKGFSLKSFTTSNKADEGLFYHRLIESFKHAFSLRSLLGDEPTNENMKTVLKHSIKLLSKN